MSDGVTLNSLHGSVPDLVPNPVSAEAWVRRFRDGYDAGFDAHIEMALADVRGMRDGWTEHPECNEQVWANGWLAAVDAILGKLSAGGTD